MLWSQGGNFPQSLLVCVVKIWREMGPFSIHILEQEGYTNMGMFLMSFSNMGTIFSVQMKHVYIIRNT